jgi:hypothetical protein
VIDTVKARRKRLGSHFRSEINRNEDDVSVVSVFVHCGLVPIGIKPFTHRRHRGRKLGGV